MGKPLTQDLVLLRSKADRLENVRNLNLWGNDIDDVSILKDMGNVEVLSLSVNKIATLRDFQFCPRLTELYLRKNLIADLSEVQYLQSLPVLKVLWLWDNPCAEAPNYRPYVIRCLPNLVKLDNQPIAPEERKAAGEAPPARPVQQEARRDPPASQAPREIPREVPREAPREVMREAPREAPQRQPSGEQRPAEPRAPRARVEASRQNGSSDSRSENILCAVLALLKELDDSELELVKRDIDRRSAQRT